MTTLATRPRHEPQENEFLDLHAPEPERAPALGAEGQYRGLLAGLLDQVEDGARRLVDAGFEDALRARLIALLVPAAVEEAPAARGDRFSETQLNVLLGLMNASKGCDAHARRCKPDTPSRRADEASRDFLRQLADDVKSGAVVIQPNSKAGGGA